MDQPQSPDKAAATLAARVIALASAEAPIDVQARLWENLQGLVAHDSASDERSDSIPSTPGQRSLAGWIAVQLRQAGAVVEIDDFGNVIAALPGRGAGVGAAPIAMMAHLDTARGTVATAALGRLPAWDGGRVPYPANADLRVDTATYPGLAAFAGQTLCFGGGRAPFGLDDKLGLAELLTLAAWLAADDRPCPPLLIIARPDEEIGRMAAVEGLAATLQARGVALGWTIDGIAPFEINVENFEAAAVRLTLPVAAFADPDAIDAACRGALELRLGGVNTHGATAKAEGHRPATRLAAELLADLDALGLGRAALRAYHFASDAERDCDGVLRLAVLRAAPASLEAQVIAAAERRLAPHLPRGASLQIEALPPPAAAALARAGATEAALALVRAILADDSVAPVAAEDSEGRQGYSQPYRVVPEGDALRLDVRLRDFDPAQLARRAAAVIALAPAGVQTAQIAQYVNMGPRLADVPALIAWPQQAAATLGIAAPVQPIRGGTGVDPFLDRGVAIGNLGTGYFAPESEKELTALELGAAHVRWLAELLEVAAGASKSATSAASR